MDLMHQHIMDACIRARLNNTLLFSTLNSTNTSEALSTQHQYDLSQSLLYCQQQFGLDARPPPLYNQQRYVRESITYYLMGISGVTVCCFGLVGNLLSLIVLTRRTMRTSTYCYLAALAVCDLLFVASTLSLLVNDLHKPVETPSSLTWDDVSIYPYIFPYVHPAAFTLQVSSVWLTLAFTVDRYIMICHPFQAEPFCTVARARKVVVGIIAGSIAFNLPKFFEYQTVVIQHPTLANVVNVGCDLTDFGNSRVFKELYHSWLYIVFVFAVPFISLAILNAFLARAVHLSRRRSKEINSVESKRMDTTIMLIGVVVIFFICQLPALVSRAIWAFEVNAQVSFTRIPLYTLNELANFLVILNSSINIVPYYFFGHRFRREFLHLFCRCLFKRRESQTSLFTWSFSRRDSCLVDNG